jgi:membrane protease subunit HflK
MAWNEPGPNRDPWNQGPGGGKRGGDGPPDLDELLRRLKARLGGKGPRGTGSGGSNLPKSLIGLAIVVIAGLWLFTGFYVVDEQERGVVMRFGAYARTTPPGWGWHAPWPVEKVEVVNVTKVRQVNDHATMLTKDENIVDVELTVQYRVSSAEQYLFSVDDPDTTLSQATKSAMRETVGRSEMDFILTEGRQAVADRIKQLLQDRLDAYKCGLIVTEVNLQQAQPPEAVQSAFADAIKAREDQQRVKNEAEAYANDRLPRARGAAARQLEEAQAYRDQVIARAEGDASRFSQLVTEYRKAPKVTRDRMYLDTMTQVLSGSSKVLVDTKEGSNQMLYLPLEQLLKAMPKTDEAPDYSMPQGLAGRNGTTVPSDPSRSRDRGR